MIFFNFALFGEYLPSSNAEDSNIWSSSGDIFKKYCE